MAITIIPIPPNHCNIALHNKIPFGVDSRFEIIVEPVVVIPDILSKNASVIESSIVENIKGKGNFIMESYTAVVRWNWYYYNGHNFNANNECWWYAII